MPHFRNALSIWPSLLSKSFAVIRSGISLFYYIIAKNFTTIITKLHRLLNKNFQETFKQKKYLCTEDRMILAQKLDLTDEQIKVSIYD